MRRVMRNVTTALVVWLAFSAPASAESTPAGDFSFEFTSSRPGAPSGLSFTQLYKNPEDADAKPSPVRQFLLAAPKGSVFDGTAVAVCNATDGEFQMMGKAACSAESQVAEGFITVMTGIPGEEPFSLDATVFNSGDGIIELFTMPGTGAFMAIERPKFVGRNAFEDTDVAPTPGGPPDFQSAAREAYLEFPVSRGPGGRSFITTPARCPAAGHWTARFEWTNADGNSYANSDDTTCVRRRDHRPPVIRARGIPDRCVGRGFRARVRVRDESAIRSVRVKLHGRTLETSSRKRFAVRIPARRLRRGGHAIRVMAVDTQDNRARRSFRFRRCR